MIRALVVSSDCPLWKGLLWKLKVQGKGYIFFIGKKWQPLQLTAVSFWAQLAMQVAVQTVSSEWYFEKEQAS